WIKLSRPAKPPTSKDNADKRPQPMVRCAQCGLHLPQNEAIASNRAVYCSDAHRELAEPHT
ncbi:MAG: PP0621 family protein, partial [Limnohabitans sp.]